MGALVLATVGLIALNRPATKPTNLLPAVGHSHHVATGPRMGGPLPLPVGPQLSAVSASGRNDIWAVGHDSISGDVQPRALVLHYGGKGWSRLSVPNIRWLVDVAAVAPGDVWAVGRAGRALHLSEGGWNVVRLPHVAGAQLKSVAGSGSDDVWIVGSRRGNHYGGDSIGNNTLTYHFDGATWTVVDSPNYDYRSNDVSDVLAVSSTDAWAIAASGTVKYALHWDGSSWHRIDFPAFARRGTTLAGLGMVHGSQVWVVGASRGIGFGKPLYLRWRGVAWQSFPGPPASGSLGTPSTLGGVSDNDIWAVGNPNQSDSSIHHYDGKRWHYANHVSDAGVPFYQLAFTDLAVIAKDDAWIVGYAPGTKPTSDRFSPQDAVIVHWDGRTWRRIAINACCEHVSAG